MSAYLCSEYQISAIVSAVDGTARDFKMLVKENLRSLESRYPGRDFLKEWQKEAKAYRFTAVAGTEINQLLKACDNFDYQACETNDYDTTKAAAFVAKVRAYAVKHGANDKSALYAAAAWSL